MNQASYLTALATNSNGGGHSTNTHQLLLRLKVTLSFH